MKDKYKTKNQLINELSEIRQKITELKSSETECMRTDEELRETKDYLDNIIEGSLDGIVVSDNMGYITRANKSFLKLIDFEEEIIGKHIMELSITEKGTYESTTGESVKIGDEFFNDANEITEKLFEEGKISNWESYYIRKDRKIVPVEMKIAYLYNEKGDIIGSVGINRDITKRKRAENALKKAYDELEKKVEERTANLKVANEQLKRKITEHKQAEEKLRRLGRSYIDGIIDDGEYNIQRKLLQDNLNSLVIPEEDAALQAGELLESLGLIWNNATDEEKYRLLQGMIEAVFVDLAASRSIVGIQPKPPFYNLFESLKHGPDNKVTIFKLGVKQKETGSETNLKPDYGMVETGESRTPRPKKATQNILQA